MPASNTSVRSMWPRKTKYYRNDICFFSAKLAALKRANADYLGISIMDPSGATSTSLHLYKANITAAYRSGTENWGKLLKWTEKPRQGF